MSKKTTTKKKKQKKSQNTQVITFMDTAREILFNENQIKLNLKRNIVTRSLFTDLTKTIVFKRRLDTGFLSNKIKKCTYY